MCCCSNILCLLILRYFKRYYTRDDVCKHYFEPCKEYNTLHPRPKFQILPPFKNTPMENPTNDIALSETKSIKQLLCTRKFLYFPISLAGSINNLTHQILC